MRISFAIVALGLLCLFSRTNAAGHGGDHDDKPGECPDTTGFIGTCDQLCNDDDECDNSLKCCSNGCGHSCQPPVPECLARAQKLKASILECLVLPIGIMRMGEYKDLTEAKYQPYICGSYDFALTCIRGKHGRELNFTDTETCAPHIDAVHDLFMRWIGSDSSLNLGEISETPAIFSSCTDRFTPDLECPNLMDVRVTFLSSCGSGILQAIEMKGIGQDARCLGVSNCYDEVKAAFMVEQNPLCVPAVEEHWERVKNDTETLNMLTGHNQNDCSDCATRAATVGTELKNCVYTPILLLAMLPLLNSDGLNIVMDHACPAYDMAFNCMKYTYAEAEQEELANGQCTYGGNFHTMLQEYIHLTAVMLNPSLGTSNRVEMLKTFYSSCTGYSQPSECPTRKMIKSAIVGNCGINSRILGMSNLSNTCSELTKCLDTTKASLKESLKKLSPGDDVCGVEAMVTSITTTADDLEDYAAVTNVNPITCGCFQVENVLLVVLGEPTCVTIFTRILMANETTYCGILKEGLDCAAKKIVGELLSMQCLKNMYEVLKTDTQAIIRVIENTEFGSILNMGNVRNLTQTVCELDDDDDEDDDDDTGMVPIELRKCSMVTEVVASLQNCVSGGLTSLDCDKLESTLTCVTDAVLDRSASMSADLKQFYSRRCMNYVVNVMMKYADRTEFSFLGNLDLKDCEDRMDICADGMKPLADTKCSNRACPTNYTCIGKMHCCPMVRPGTCPRMTERPVCSRMRPCSMDSNCPGPMKCCNQGCGYKTCTMMETREKSMCEQHVDKAELYLKKHGVCGTGTGAVFSMPQCQNTGFAPIQCDLSTGLCQCVKPDGTRIPGSVFRGNKDCPRTHNGTCPRMPDVCMGLSKDQISEACKSDNDCQLTQKCCYVQSGQSCLKRCRTAENTDGNSQIQVCPAGVERKCCPANLCQGKKSLIDESAVCRINPCGECKVEFYNIHGELVDDTAGTGLSQCIREKAMARMKNKEMMKSATNKLQDFIQSKKLFNDMDGGSMGMHGMDEDSLETMRLNVNDMDDDKDITAEDYHDDDEEEAAMETNEYGERVRGMDMLELGEREREIYTALRRSSADMVERVVSQCALFNKYEFCKNGGTCSIGQMPEAYLQICQCQPGYYGLFCEKQGGSGMSKCMLYKEVTDSMMSLMSEWSMKGHLIHRILTIFQIDYDIFPKVTCDTDGNFTRIQHGMILPITATSQTIQFCVDTVSGVRERLTLIALEGENLDCSSIVAPDVLTLPRRCRLQPVGTAQCENGADCQQYYFNSVTEVCEKSTRNGYGFDDLSQCYAECGLQYQPHSPDCLTLQGNDRSTCEPCYLEGCHTACCQGSCENNYCQYLMQLPKPCEGVCSEIDYGTKFCLINNDNGIGECKEHKSYCFQPVDPGEGDKKIGAYYFNTVYRRCFRFEYKGSKGNWNRFYSLHQCQTECLRNVDYKSINPVCPIPRSLMPMMGSPNMADMCDDDYDCPKEQVCCSNGYARVCSHQIKMCGSRRCSMDALCVNDTCICPSCHNEAMSPVCGSNGHRFPNLCMLKKYSCEHMMNITEVPCPTTTSALTPPEPSPCPMSCTKEYNPVCVIYKTAGGDATKTVGNLCTLAAANRCDNENLKVLYMGECMQGSCAPYQMWMDGNCVCPTWNDVNFHPVCARPDFDGSTERTFANQFQMRKYGCENNQHYIITKFEACSKPEPMYECPATRPDILGSAEYRCNSDNNEYCDENSKCCPYGAGNRCIPKKLLKQKKVRRAGFCPILSYLNFNRHNCYNPALWCKDDSDAPEYAKCCDNYVCGHKTLAVAIGTNMDGLCPSNMKAAGTGVTCDPTGENVCPSGSMCIAVDETKFAGWKGSGLCCQSASDSTMEVDEMAAYKSQFCTVINTLAQVDVCNGLRCIGDVENAQMCECPEGKYGTFCDMMKPADTCSNPVQNCPNSTCEDAMCSVEGAVCSINNCGGCHANWTLTVDGEDKDITAMCHAPKCRRLEAMMSAVFGLLPPQDLPTTNRKKRGTNNDDMVWDDPAFAELGIVMRKMGFNYVPQLGIVNCEPDGSFTSASCFQSVEYGVERSTCTCVDRHTGMPIKNAPRRKTLEGLDCTFANARDFPKKCQMMPSNRSCGDETTERYFFNLQTLTCEKYMDSGCNDLMFGNSFESMDKCIGICSHPSVTPVGCASVRCPGGTKCVRENNQLKCVDITRLMAAKNYPEPQCEENGDYSPRQCNGDACYCANRDGTPVEESLSDGQVLTCIRDAAGNTQANLPQIIQRKACQSGIAAKICKGDKALGDPCNNCDPPTGNQPGNNMVAPEDRKDSKVGADGVCTNCQQCGSGQGQQSCTTTCEDAPMCQKAPSAECRVDRCTCTRGFYLGEKKINCNAHQSECLKVDAYLQSQAAEERFRNRVSGASNAINIETVRCTAAGLFVAGCTGNRCYCLNATGFQEGPSQTEITIEEIKCTVKKVTKLRNIIQISSRILGSIPQATRAKVLDFFLRKMRRLAPIILSNARLVAGSVYLDVEVQLDPNSDVPSDTDDLPSIMSQVNSELMADGEEEIDGIPFGVTGTPTVEVLVVEEEEPEVTPTDSDDTNVGLIIGCVVGGIALLLIIIVVCVVCNRNSQKKDSSMQFSNLQGKDNPMYHNKA